MSGSADLAARHVARGGIVAFGVFAAGAGLTYCAQLLIARAIGAEGYGVYAYVFAWMTLLAYGAALGFDVSLLRFIPAYRATREASLLRGVVLFAERSALGAGLAIVAIGALVVWLASARLDRRLAETFLIGLLLVPLWALLWVRCSIVRAHGRVLAAIAPDRLVRDGALILLIGAASLAGGGVSAPFTMGATVFSALIALGAVSWAKRGCGMALVRPTYAAQIWCGTALPLVAIGVADVGMNRVGVVLLGFFGQTTAAGIYALAFNIAFLTVLPRTAINALFAPTIAAMFARGDRSGLQALAARASLWALAGSACLALPLAVLAEPILAWFGPAFLDGAPALRLLLLGQVAVAGAGSQLHLLAMTGHERAAAWVMLASVAASVAAGAMLIAPFGLIGAAVAAALTLIFCNTATTILAWRDMRVLPGIVLLLRPRALAPCALVLLGAASSCLAAGQDRIGSAHLTDTPAMPRPDYLQSVIDPAFGTPFTRVTDPGRELFPEVACGAAYCSHRYSSSQAWNADQSLLLINLGCSGYCFLDGHSYAPLFHRAGRDECEWHPTKPALMICVDAAEIYLWEPCADTRTVVFHAEGYSGLQFGPYKGNPSADGTRLVVRATHGEDGPVAFAYDIAKRTKFPDIALGSLAGVNGFCGISSSGRYVFCSQVMPDDTNQSYVFTAKGRQIQHWAENHRPGHGDMTADADGEDVYVGVSKSDPDRYHIIKRRLRDGMVTDLAPFGEGQHASIRNTARPGWVFLTYTGSYTELEAHPNWAPFFDEIVALRIDGSGELRRIVQTRSAKSDYWSEAHGSPSPDGTQVIWSSNWGDPGGPVSDYVARLNWPAAPARKARPAHAMR